MKGFYSLKEGFLPTSCSLLPTLKQTFSNRLLPIVSPFRNSELRQSLCKPKIFSAEFVLFAEAFHSLCGRPQVVPTPFLLPTSYSLCATQSVTSTFTPRSLAFFTRSCKGSFGFVFTLCAAGVPEPL